MILALLIAWLVVAAAFAVTSWLLPGVEVTGGFGSYLWVSLLFGLVNAIVGTFMRIIAAPLIVVTLGLVALLINALLLLLTDAISDSLEIDGFWNAVLAAIVVSLATVVIGALAGLLAGRGARR